jgi:putative inorganic carbon (HCO3(-)) transporter
MVLNSLNGFVHQLLRLGNGWLDSGSKAGVLAGLFFLPLSLTAAWISFSLAAALWLGRMLWQGEVAFRRTGLDLWLAGFVLAAALSVWQSDHTAEIWYNYCYLIGLYVLVYCVVVQTMHGPQDTDRAAAALLASSVAVCLIGLFQYVVGVDVIAQRWIDSEQFPELKTRVFSTLGNPNVLAAFLVMTAGLSLGWSTDVHRRNNKLALLLVAALSIVCVLLTYSRGAWLALGVMGLLLLLSGRRPGRRSLVLSIAIIGILAFWAHESLLPRFRSILGMFNPADSSVALRWALWESTLAMINEHPWLGLGWGSYRFIYPEYDFFVQNPDVIIYHGHNTLLSLAAEIGLPGAMLFAVAWAIICLQSLLRGWKQGASAERGLYFGFFLAFGGMAAFSLTDHVLFNVQVTAVFWSMLGAVAVSNRALATNKARFWLHKKFRGLAGFF